MAPSAITTIEEYQFPLKDLQSINHIAVGSIDNHGAWKSKQLIEEALKSRIEAVNHDTCGVGDEDAFFVADLGEVYRQHLRWKKNLPRVQPHYAVKCNPDPQVLRLMTELGLGFDCASKNEIEAILKLGVDPSRIIYAQPCKTKSYVRYAAQASVKQMTFDNADELYKTKQLFPDAELYLRILTDDSASLCRLSQKFGASLDTASDLLGLAKRLELNVVGVAFQENVASALFRRWLRLYLPILGITFLWMCFRHSTKIWVENPPLEPTFWAEVVNWYRTFKNYSFVFSENIYPFSSTYQQHTWSIPIEFKGSIVIYTSVTALSKCTKKARLWCEVGLAIYFLYIVDGYYGTLFMCGMLLCDLHLLSEKDELPEFLTALAAYKEFIFLNLFLFGLYLGGVPTCDYLNRDHMTVISGTPGWKWLSYLKPQAVFDPKWFYLTWAAFLTVASIPHLPLLKNFFETRFCQYLARISFALYLVHGPVMFLLGSRLYSAVGFEWFLNRDNIPGWMNIFPLSKRGPMGLEFAFWAVQLINVPVTLYMAELATKFLDEPSVRFSSWAYRITLAPPSTPKR